MIITKRIKEIILGFVIFYSFFILDLNVFAGSFDEALSNAKEQNKLVVVDVFTDWCGWCKKMDKDTYSNSDIKDLIDDNFVYVKLNAEGSEKQLYNGKSYTSADLSYYFQVDGFPTHVFLDSDGKVIEFKYNGFKMTNLPGYYAASSFKKILKYFIEGKYKDTDLSTIL